MLDNNRIAIRERNLLEIMDLALAVLRAHGLPLIGLLILGIAPMFALNHWLLAEAADVEYLEAEPPADFLFGLCLLLALETPLATALGTLYLGQSMFSDTPRAKQALRDFWKQLPQLLFFQIFLRGLFVAGGVFIIPLAIPYVGWPYINEVILLERNPMLGRNKSQRSTWRRSQLLHGGSRGDLLSRLLGSLLIGTLLVVSLWLSMWVLASQLTGYWHSHHSLYTIYLPVAVWIVIGFFTVVRFLSYLDLRIRREGWEVELALRAEGQRYARQLT